MHRSCRWVSLAFFLSAMVLTSCVNDQVELTLREQCAIDVLRVREAAGDDCMANCIESGEGRNIGGGCQHLCFSFTEVGSEKIEWSRPAELDSCFSIAESP